MIGPLLLLMLAARPAIPERLTLKEAIDLALRSAPALQRAAAEVQRMTAQTDQAVSRLRPEVHLSVVDTGQTVNLKTIGIDSSFLPALPVKAGPFQTVDARGHLSWALWDAPSRSRVSAAREQVSVSRHLASEARSLLCFQVSLAFAEALRAQGTVATLEQQLTLGRKLHATTLDRTSAGVSSRLDATRSEIQTKNLEQSLHEATYELAARKLELARLLNAEPSAAFSLTPEERPSPAEAVEPRADYRAAEAAVKAAELRLQAARRERYPTASLRANIGQSGRGWNDNLNTFLIQGVLNIPVYTGGRTEADIAEAEARLADARAQLEEVRARGDAELLTARAALDAANKQVAVARDTVRLARDEVDLSTERFLSGVADNTEVVNAQERLTRAEDAAVRAAYHLDVAIALWRRAAGVAK